MPDSNQLKPPEWVPTREEGLRRLSAFLPNAGGVYARRRNHDLGPDDRSNVSTLSPWIRHRLVGEGEVVHAVLRAHGYEAAEKFLQEVLWRTYWKGWLEMRPTVWADYRVAVDRWVEKLAGDDDLRRRVGAATEGRTGIGCYDCWVRELLDQGYLHNHARMWFASIWIFTLKLPWALGADFFLRFLLDGDPASNTLSWRWVAGIQTPGKTYLARPDNIAKFTGKPVEANAGLATVAPPVTGAAPPPARPLPAVAPPDPDAPSGLLVTEEEGRPETLDMPRGAVKAVAGLICTRDRSPLPVGERAVRFAAGAVADAVERAGASLGCPAAMLSGPDPASAAAEWVRAHDLRQVVTAYPPAGPVQERLHAIRAVLAGSGVAVVFVRREWDERFWPHATRGFFAFREHIPRLLVPTLKSGPAPGCDGSAAAQSKSRKTREES